MLSYALARDEVGPGLDGTDIGDTHLVGLGEIGNGAIWALARAAGLKGSLRLVDHEDVDEGPYCGSNCFQLLLHIREYFPTRSAVAAIPAHGHQDVAECKEAQARV